MRTTVLSLVRAEEQLNAQGAELELARGTLDEEIRRRIVAEEELAAAEARRQSAEERVQRRSARIVELESRVAQMATEQERLRQAAEPGSEAFVTALDEWMETPIGMAHGYPRFRMGYVACARHVRQADPTFDLEALEGFAADMIDIDDPVGDEAATPAAEDGAADGAVSEASSGTEGD